jgi:hypothetical protein
MAFSVQKVGPILKNHTNGKTSPILVTLMVSMKSMFDVFSVSGAHCYKNLQHRSSFANNQPYVQPCNIFFYFHELRQNKNRTNQK